MLPRLVVHIIHGVASEERDALAASCCVPALFAMSQNVQCLLVATSKFSMHVITRLLDFHLS